MIPINPKRKLPAAKPGRPARNYMFTVNFGCNDRGFIGGVPRLLDPEQWSSHSVKFCVYQLEIGETGTLHFQGYLECRGNKSMKQLHTLEGLERAAMFVRRGSQAEAIAYVTKQDETYLDGPWYWGERSEQGKRSDLLEIKEKIDKGALMASIAQENFGSWIRHGKMFKEYKRQLTPTRNFKSRVFLFVGPAGAGKSTIMKTIARYIGPMYKVPQKKGSGLYFDDYDGQDILMLDEFDGATMSPTFFNTLCDEHECILPVHGGAGHQMVSRYIFIGTNYMPSQWWKNRNPKQLRQTTRRIDVTFKMGFKNIPAAPIPPKARVITVLARFPPKLSNIIVIPLSAKGKEELDDPEERR